MKSMLKPHLFSLSLLLCAAGPLAAQSELIPNDKFADEGAAWNLQSAQDAAASLSVVDDQGEKALLVTVEAPADSENAPDVRIQRLFGLIDSGKDYHITFQAKSETPAAINPYIYPQNEGAKVLWRTTANLEPDWKEFTFTFKGRDTADNCVLGFAGLGKSGNKFWFKDVVLTAD
jgi:hypothetical protein